MWFWIVILVLSVLVAVLYRPKVQDPAATKTDAPEVLDGRKIRKVYGTVWIDDSMMLAWKQAGTIPIKSSGGK